MHQFMRIIAFFALFLARYQWPYPVAAAAATYLHASLPECWDDLTQFSPIVYRNCIDVINNEITKGRDPDIPLMFSNDPTMHPDIKVPTYWKSSDSKCGVGVDMAFQLRSYDRTTLNDIKRAAKVVAVECIIKPPHLGGAMQLGWHERLGVLITGGKPRPIRLNGTLSES